MNALNDNNGDNTDDEGQPDEAVKFTAQQHVAFFRTTFSEFYDIDLDDWVICQTADNCNVNKKIAGILGIPLVGCKSHLLNLEVNGMVTNNQDLDSVILSIQSTMAQCKRSIKNAALLCNVTPLVAILYNKTRWSGKYQTLQ